MFKFLKRSYPFNEDLRQNIISIFVISVAVFLFLFLFQPLDLNKLSFEDKMISLAGVGIVTFVALSINLLLIPVIFSHILNSGRWMIWKEILWNIWMLFIISSGYILYYKLIGLAMLDIGIATFLKILLLGSLPFVFLIPINQDRLRRIYRKNATTLNQRIEEKHILPQLDIVFESEYLKDSLKVKVFNLLSVSSAGNYIEVVWLDDKNIPNKQLVRTSLQKAEQLLAKYTFMYRCHRSHMININHVLKVEGNYQGYRAFLHPDVLPIPVSRNYIAKFQSMI